MKNLLAKRGDSADRCPHGRLFDEACVLCEELPKIPDAKPNVQGMLISNPAWRRYMRKEDTWEGDAQ